MDAIALNSACFKYQTDLISAVNLMFTRNTRCNEDAEDMNYKWAGC